MTRLKRLLITGAIFLGACSSDHPVTAVNSPVFADVIFTHAVVVTVDETNPQVEAVAVKDGKILQLGSNQDVAALVGPATETIDLQGKTLAPGFVDGHSHFSHAVIMATWVNVSPPPVGPAESVDTLLAALVKRVEQKPLAKDEWLFAYGYDENVLGRHITRDDLDPYFPDNPVVLMHISGHGAILNSRAFAKAGINADTPTPEGGVIARMPGSQKPAGLLMETAWIPVAMELLTRGQEDLDENFQAAQRLYASNGYTTMQDGSTRHTDLKRYAEKAAQQELYLDLMVLPLFIDLEQVLADPQMIPGRFLNRMKLTGIKILADGSPQGKTAFFTRPLLTPGPTGEEGWVGEPTMPYEQYLKIFQTAHRAGWRVYTHGNGDASIDMVLKAHREEGISAKDERRNVVIHSQFVRPDQLDSYVELGITPSYFSNHAYYWGDVHLQNLGEERASFLSPMKTSTEKGLRYSNHSDYIITPLDPMMTIWTAVKRETRSGRVLGADERVSPLQALKAITIDAAYQYFEEDTRGSLEIGKLADLVVLSDNPLTVDSDAIRDIKVLATYKEGRPVFQAPQ